MAGAKDVKFRSIEDVAIPAAAGPTRTKLPITEVIQCLNLFLDGTVTIAVADAKGFLGEGVLSLIRGVTVEAVSASRREVGKIKFADFAALYNLNKFLRGTTGLYSIPDNAKQQVATAIKADVQLDFQFPHSESSRQTLLNTTELTSLEAILDWGTYADFIDDDGGKATVTLPNTVCRIGARELVDVDAKQVRYGINQFTYQEIPVINANSRLQVDLKRGYLLRGFLIKQFTRNGVYYHTPVNTAINSIKLELNRNVKIEFKDWDVLQGQNIYDYRMPSCPTGYAFIDLMEDGKYDKIINTNTYRDVNVVLDVPGLANGYVRIYPVEIIPANL